MRLSASLAKTTLQPLRLHEVPGTTATLKSSSSSGKETEIGLAERAVAGGADVRV